MAWKRPNLGIVDVNGSRDNNIVNIFGTDGGSIFIDPSAPPAERYKLMAEGHFSGDVCDAYLKRRPNDWDPKSGRTADGGASGMKGAASADGLHWTMFPDPMVVEVTDTQLTAYFDERLRKYVAYTRTWAAGVRSARTHPQERRTWGVSRRSIGRSETSNYREFPLHETFWSRGSTSCRPIHSTRTARQPCREPPPSLAVSHRLAHGQRQHQHYIGEQS